jgi:hypothetical protein
VAAKFTVESEQNWLISPHGESLVQIWFCSREEYDEEFVYTFPTRACMDYTDIRRPLFYLSTSPLYWNPEGFLGILAQIAAEELIEPGMEIQLRGHTPAGVYWTIPLTRNMNLFNRKGLIEVCNFKNGLTEKFLEKHLTFNKPKE